MNDDKMTTITYTPAETPRSIYRKIVELLDNDKSWAQIGKALLPSLLESQSKAIVYRFYMHNDVPKNNEIRMLLGLPILKLQEYHPGTVQAIPCPTCGEVHPCDCGLQRVTRLPGSGPRRSPRIAVSKVDPRAAAKSLTDNLPQDVLREVVHILANEVAPEWYG